MKTQYKAGDRVAVLVMASDPDDLLYFNSLDNLTVIRVATDIDGDKTNTVVCEGDQTELPEGIHVLELIRRAAIPNPNYRWKIINEDELPNG